MAPGFELAGSAPGKPAVCGDRDWEAEGPQEQRLYRGLEAERVRPRGAGVPEPPCCRGAGFDSLFSLLFVLLSVPRHAVAQSFRDGKKPFLGSRAR